MYRFVLVVISQYGLKLTVRIEKVLLVVLTRIFNDVSFKFCVLNLSCSHQSVTLI